MSLDSHSQSTGRGTQSDHNDDNESDHNSADGSGLELPADDPDLDMPFDDGDYQHSNIGNQSPDPSNAGSYDQVHDPVVPPECTINRTYHPTINGGSLLKKVVLLFKLPITHNWSFRDNL
jgi:hypothetical protein